MKDGRTWSNNCLSMANDAGVSRLTLVVVAAERRRHPRGHSEYVVVVDGGRGRRCLAGCLRRSQGRSLGYGQSRPESEDGGLHGRKSEEGRDSKNATADWRYPPVSGRKREKEQHGQASGRSNLSLDGLKERRSKKQVSHLQGVPFTYNPSRRRFYGGTRRHSVASEFG